MPIPDGYEKLAIVGIVDKGEYSGDATYKKYNFVYYQGSTYLTLKDNPTGPPADDGDNWRYLARGTATKEDVVTALGYTPDAQPQKKEVTLLPAQWTGESFPYLYTIPLPDTTATQRIYATAAPGLTEPQINAFAEACITGKEQTDGQIVLQAVHKPSVELPIVIEIGGVVADVEG